VLLHGYEQAHTRELDIYHISLPLDLYTYARATPKFSIAFDAATVPFSSESLLYGPRRSTPIAFSIRGLTNGIFSWFRFFMAYLHGKSRLGPLSQGSLRQTRSESFPPTRASPF
jgi:hypothetical protein